MREVETEPIGCDQRACLVGVVADHLTKRPVEDVGARVVLTKPLSSVVVDLGSDFLSNLDVTVRDGPPMSMDSAQRESRVSYGNDPCLRRDGAGVAQLTSGLTVRTVCDSGISRCPGQARRIGLLGPSRTMARMVLAPDSSV